MPAASAAGAMSSARSRLRTTSSRASSAGGREREAAVAHHHGGDAVPARVGAELVPEHLRVHVGVPVDEAGRDHVAVGVDVGGAALLDATDRGDAAVDDADVGAVRREAGAVDDGPVADDDVEAHLPPLVRGDRS